jgi:hypothetical protein
VRGAAMGEHVVRGAAMGEHDVRNAATGGHDAVQHRGEGAIPGK